jgi:hypothetical protein
MGIVWYEFLDKQFCKMNTTHFLSKVTLNVEIPNCALNWYNTEQRTEWEALKRHFEIP